MFLVNTLSKVSGPAGERRFVRRVFRLRSIGLALGVPAVGSVLYQLDAAWPLWALLLCNGLLWPSIARAISNGAGDAVRRERMNLLIDSAMGGFWIAVMQFNLVPSALLMSMLAIDKIHFGGWRLLARTLVAQVLVCALTFSLQWLHSGELPLAFPSTMFTVVASLPLLFLYPVLLSAATYSLNHSAHRQSRELERQNAIDAFTGLSNRTSWEAKVDKELYRASHFGHSASLLMIDIDHFKTINDRYGHPAGDAVIAAVAETIKACVRDIDHAGRYGGDEFCVLLTHTGEHAATVVAERIRSRVNEARLTDAPDLVCTLSIGVAAAGRGMRTSVDWVERADTALYRAKALGRNRTVRVGDIPGRDARPVQTFTES